MYNSNYLIDCLCMQVISTLGAVVGPTPDGGFGYLDNMTPERVEAGGKS